MAAQSNACPEWAAKGVEVAVPSEGGDAQIYGEIADLYAGGCTVILSGAPMPKAFLYSQIREWTRWDDLWPQFRRKRKMSMTKDPGGAPLIENDPPDRIERLLKIAAEEIGRPLTKVEEAEIKLAPEGFIDYLRVTGYDIPKDLR